MTRFTRDDRNDMARQYLAGDRPSTIARQFGTSVGYVIMLARQYAEANGIDINTRVPKPKPERDRKKRKSQYISKPPASISVKPAIKVDPHTLGSGRRHPGGYTKLM